MVEIEKDVLSQIQTFSGPKEPAALNGLGDKTALQVKTSFATAVSVKQPRSITRVRDNLLLEARLAGESFYYRWTIKTKKGPKVVEGPSIDLGMSLARLYGNCAIDIEVVAESDTHWVFKATFIDLESGFTCPRLFQQRKSQDIGKKMGADRAQDMVFQLGQSKAQRNAIIKAMPAWLVHRAMEVAREAAISAIPDDKLAAARQAVVDFFGQYGIDQERLEAGLGKPIEMLVASDIADLRATKAAILDGQVNAWEVFPPIKDEEERPKTRPKRQDPESPPPEPPVTEPDEQPGIGDYPAAPAGKSSGPPVPPPPPEDEPSNKDWDTQKFVQPGEAPPAPQPSEPQHVELWERNNWIRMRGGKPPETGFYAWVYKFKHVLEGAPEDVKRQIKEKWEGLYKNDYPFPLSIPEPEKAPGPEPDLPPEMQPSATSELFGQKAVGEAGYGKPLSEPEWTQDPPKDNGQGYEYTDPFKNLDMDLEGAQELKQRVLGDQELFKIWKKHLTDFPFNSAGDVQRVNNFLTGQKERETLANSGKRM